MKIEAIIGNINDGSNYYMSCINCGETDKVHWVAHRNEAGKIVGFLFSCDSCHKDLVKHRVILEKTEEG